MTTTSATTTILATGFYGRGNLGDELYPLVLRRVFGDSSIACHCTDDLEVIPPGTNAVVVGGGDIVNPFFMDKVASLLEGFGGPAYLISAGIPFAAGPDLRYLRMFDHVFVRTAADFRVASSVLPPEDVTCFRDMAWSLPRRIAPAVPTATTRVVGLTLAQPYYANNPHAEALKSATADLVASLAATHAVVYLIAFNTRLTARDECDIYINREIAQRVGRPNVVCVEDVTDPEAMLALVAGLDLLVAMRLHSVIFAAMQQTRFVCMYTTQKLANFLEDVGAGHYGYQLPIDPGTYKPTGLDVGHALSLIAQRRQDPEPAAAEPSEPAIDWQAVASMISARKRKAVMAGVPASPVKSFEQAQLKCRRMVEAYTGMSPAAYQAWLHGSLKTTQAVDPEQVSLLELCRIICYALTDSTTSPCLWGLHQNCQTDDFKLLDALRYIHADHLASSLALLRRRAAAASSSSSSSPPASSAAAAAFGHRVSLTTQDLTEFSDVHRAGWPYVVGGLTAFQQDADERVLVDTFVDRTFHWGHDALLQEGTFPYARPWIGFVHHTFIIDHGPYNCTTLFQKPAFLQSLSSCVCLVAMSEYLASQLRQALDAAGAFRVGVEVLLHPTEPVPDALRFSMSKLLDNPQPKLVQIGSWLRSAYALYKMPHVHHGPPLSGIKLQRCILKAKECSNYMKPPAVEAALEKMLAESQLLRDRNLPRAPNFYVRELIEHLREQEASVLLLDRLDNAEYDQLMACNVVFLRVVDASAVNTVIEAAVRATPLIVNRHPAICEYLGADYPGFYDTLEEAAATASSLDKLAACHAYMKHKVDTSRLSLDAFLAGFAAILDKYL